MSDEKDLNLPEENQNPEEAAPMADATPDENPAAESAAPAESGDDVAVADAAPVGDTPEAEADASGDSEDDMLKMLDGLPTDDSKASADDIDFEGTAVSRAEFQHLQEPVSSPDAHNIDLLMDVDLPIAIELGRTKLSISDILGLGPGSVVELNKLAGEPVDLLVNHKVVALGEVVVIDENFGLRITQLMTPEERLKALAEE